MLPRRRGAGEAGKCAFQSLQEALGSHHPLVAKLGPSFWLFAQVSGMTTIPLLCFSPKPLFLPPRHTHTHMQAQTDALTVHIQMFLKICIKYLHMRQGHVMHTLTDAHMRLCENLDKRPSLCPNNLVPREVPDTTKGDH